MNKLDYIRQLLSLENDAIKNTVQLLDEGCTVPFIARYRKDHTKGLDEVEIAAIRDHAKKFEEITARQATIIHAIDQSDKLTTELKSKIEACFELSLLEDLYLPYKVKRETRGEKAKKKGLEPLAKMIMSQGTSHPEDLAHRFVGQHKVESTEEAISGAKDIIAEWINESADVRNRVRNYYQKKAILKAKLVKGKEELAEKYKDYFDFTEPIYKLVSHRFLALTRAQKEGFLTVKIQPTKEEVLPIIERFFVKGTNPCADIISEAVAESYKRLIHPSIENEVFNELKAKADEQAIKVFSTNLKQLLLAPPLGGKRILAIDPGFKSGCKVVCLDEAGDLLTNVTIFPHPPQKEADKAMSKLFQLVQAYKIEVIAIGDGTAGRETEFIVKKTKFDRDLDVFSVREDGASIYSASSIARKEFPNYDVTVRGAVSIGRRLMDPLAELVKIDPKSVGVGQYQHEVDQTELKTALDDVVVSCVNKVGVDLNTASPYLLSYVSGLGFSLAENIVAYRHENGLFTSRSELKKVKRLGDKAFEQAAGFLRIRDAKNPLDNSAIHPENYSLVSKIAKKLKVEVAEMIGNENLLSNLKQTDFTEINQFTFEDIINELKKPGRDPRKKVKVMEFDSTIRSLSDLKVGMKLMGIVTNVTAFGAFVNIGIKENGLIHKSNLSDTYVSDPAQYISLHEHVNVEVLEIDVPRKRLGLKKVMVG